MLAVFSLSFVVNDSTNLDDDTNQAVEKARAKPPRNG